MPNIDEETNTETVYLEGGPLWNMRKRLIPLDANELTFMEAAPGAFYYRTDREIGDETVFEYRA